MRFERKAAAGFVSLTANERRRLINVRQTAFNSLYWDRYIDDKQHFHLVMKTRRSPDYRLLYDSWLWRCILHDKMDGNVESSILELLPGSSLTIPVALESVGFRGRLCRVNEERPIVFPETIRFKGRWLRVLLNDLAAKRLPYDLIIGNHIIDDLLFALHVPDLRERKHNYMNAGACKECWNEIAKVASAYILQLETVFVEIVKNMVGGAVFILRHYPSTFALLSGDLLRVNIEMKAYFAITSALLSCETCSSGFLDTSGITVAGGSRYPYSFFLLQKKL